MLCIKPITKLIYTSCMCLVFIYVGVSVKHEMHKCKIV